MNNLITDICSIISTPLFFRSLENLYSFDSYIWEKNEGMPYFEPFFCKKKNGEMHSADSPFWPFIAFRVNGRVNELL